MGSVLYNTLKRMIERGQTEDIETKLDVFYAASKINKAEYTELINALRNQNNQR